MGSRTHIIFLCLITTLSACRKKYDHPPFVALADGHQTTVQQLRQKVALTSSVYRFAGGDTSLYCTVTADETSGNFYSAVFVRDDEHVAIQVNLTEPGGVYTGDRLRINLNGVTVRHANNCFTLDSVSTARNIVKLSSGNKVVPKPVTMEQLLQSLNGGIDLQSDLVTLDEAEFVYEHRGVTLADAIAQTKKELTLTNCNGYTIALQTSGFANFASKHTPHEHGSVTAVVTRYGSTLRLQMRAFSDLNMKSAACTSSLSTSTGTFVLAAAVATLQEQFDQVNDEWELQLAGWINYNEAGRARWRGDLKAEEYRSVKATAFGTGEKNTTWLISPPVTYSADKKISFRTAVEYFKYGHIEPLMAYVSTNFNGKNLKTANWSALSQANYAGHSDGNYTGPGGMKSSGEMRLADIPLLAAALGTFCLAFKYTGEPGFDTNVYVDDVVVK